MAFKRAVFSVSGWGSTGQNWQTTFAPKSSTDIIHIQPPYQL
ncbi:hypothetical protein [Motilimonas pumila]|nr:hypothetical protein [Motilimonas pumila]